MHTKKANKPNPVAATVLATILFATAAVLINTTENAAAYEKNQATTQTSACGNGLVSTNVGCQNTDSQIQGDENVVALTAQQTFPAITEESTSSPPDSPPSEREENCKDGLDNDEDGLIDARDPDCERSAPPAGSDQPLEE